MTCEHPLVGQVVDVTWARPGGDDWCRFRVKAVAQGWVRLQGLPRSASESYGGGPIWVPDREILCLEEVPDA